MTDIVASEANPLRIDGDLSIRNTEDLHRRFSTALEAGGGMVVDFAGVEACDAAALQLICSVSKTAARRGQGFRVTALAPAIEEAAAAIGLAVQELMGADPAGGSGPVPGGSGCGL